MDCSWVYGNQGCNGGNIMYVNDYLLDYKAMTEDSYPYLGWDNQCYYNDYYGITKI